MNEIKLFQYEIVEKIVIRDNFVHIFAADNDIRPLQFTYREDSVLTDVFRKQGLHGLLEIVARDIYRRKIHLRAGSRITRAIRRALHELTLEQFQAMEEDPAVERLVELAEQNLSNGNQQNT